MKISQNKRKLIVYNILQILFNCWAIKIFYPAIFVGFQSRKLYINYWGLNFFLQKANCISRYINKFEKKKGKIGGYNEYVIVEQSWLNNEPFVINLQNESSGFRVQSKIRARNILALKKSKELFIKIHQVIEKKLQVLGKILNSKVPVFRSSSLMYSSGSTS